MLRIIAIVFCWIFASLAVSSVYAQRTGNPEKDAELADRQAAKRGPAKIADNAPDRYTVVKGDTLWGIASKFLNDPWRWADVWRGNKDQVKDPHLIFPGDVLVLDRKNGTISLDTKGRSVPGETKLSPTVRSESSTKAVPLLPANVIEPYLSRPQIVEFGEGLDNAGQIEAWKKAPQVIEGKEGRSLLASGDIAYVTGLEGDKVDWNVYRPGKVLKDPKTGEAMGTEAVYVGKVKVVRRGEPAEVRVGKFRLEVTPGDRLMMDERPLVTNYRLKSPSKEVEGHVMSIYGGVDTGGPYSIITINRGKRAGLEIGDVLALFRSTHTLEHKDDSGQVRHIQPADDRYGLVTIFRVGERISYALVMDAGRELAVGDTLRNP
jgi:hypothetical protein